MALAAAASRRCGPHGKVDRLALLAARDHLHLARADDLTPHMAALGHDREPGGRQPLDRVGQLVECRVGVAVASQLSKLSERDRRVIDHGSTAPAAGCERGRWEARQAPIGGRALADRDVTRVYIQQSVAGRWCGRRGRKAQQELVP